MTFGAVLRLLRVDAGLSLRSMATSIGVSNAYLSRVENGHDAPPTADRLAAIAKTLNLPPLLLIELAERTSPFVAQYLAEVPEAAGLFIDVARRRLTARQIRDVRSLIDTVVPRSSGEPPSLGRLLTAESALPLMSCRDQADALDVAATRAAAGVGAHDVAQAMRRRESETPSYVGAGVWIPHAVVPGATLAAAVVTLATPLPAPTPDGRPLQVVVAIAGPSADRRLLELLATTARLARPDVVAALVAASTSDALIAAIRCQEHA